MTEKEKMIRGEFYCAGDKELINDRAFAQRTCFEYNLLDPDKTNEKSRLLSQLFGYNLKCVIEPPFKCDYGYNIRIGKNFYANFGVIILDVNIVTIGNNVKFGPNVQIYSATHPTDPQERVAGKEMGYPITIGDNVWIGGGAIICPGVTVGSNTTIGAGSVVTKDIPSSVIAVGNPCRVITNL